MLIGALVALVIMLVAARIIGRAQANRSRSSRRDFRTRWQNSNTENNTYRKYRCPHKVSVFFIAENP